jgi:hypothetical protein
MLVIAVAAVVVVTEDAQRADRHQRQDGSLQRGVDVVLLGVIARERGWTAVESGEGPLKSRMTRWDPPSTSVPSRQRLTE